MVRCDEPVRWGRVVSALMEGGAGPLRRGTPRHKGSAIAQARSPGQKQASGADPSSPTQRPSLRVGPSSSHRSGSRLEGYRRWARAAGFPAARPRGLGQGGAGHEPARRGGGSWSGRSASGIRDWPLRRPGVPSDRPAQAVGDDNRVVAVNALAARSGVAVGMRRREAEAICPTVLTVAVDPGAEAARFEPVAVAIEGLIPPHRGGDAGPGVRPDRWSRSLLRRRSGIGRSSGR